MAKTVSDIFLKLNVEGKEALEKLKSSFRTLDRTIGVSNKAIEQLRQETLSFGSSSRVTIASIKGQIEALKGLQQQSTVNSGTYKRLTEDINKLNEQLGKLDGTVTTVKRNLGSFQVPGYKPDAFATAIQARRTELQGLAIDSREYLDVLTGITAYERRQSFIGGRQQAAAAAGAAARPMPTRATAVELPSTVAGLRQRMSELNFEVDNLELNSDQLRSAQRELTQVQQELNEALGGTSSVYQQLERQENAAIRRAEKLAGIQEYYATQGTKAPGAGGYRDPVTGAMIARGTVAGRRPLPVERPMREISGLYQQIGQIGMSGITADIERMGKGYREVADDIRAASIASNGSITSLQAQRSAWVSLSATLNPASREYREVGRQIDRVERRLDRLTKKQKLSTRIKGNLGAAAAGAIFGGPEAAIGGLVAGPLGAGAGATASMARQGLGEFASYAAEIEKLQIALEGVTKTQDAYIYSLETARKATTDFNIPIDQSTRNITRLSAAVLGAGGNVGDAELVFRNVTAAVKATGGSADDVNSAITAMVQVFSKGKVSAEELSGQLGERLPGAVTLFAKAVYGDGHDAMIQLQDDLKAGTVGLNELMKFAQALGVEYTDLAKQIADSTADAGAKAKVAFDQARLEIGKALQPIGAELQTAIADFLVQNQAEIIAIAKTLSQVFAGLLDVLAFLVRNFEELAAVAAVVASTAGLIKVVAVVKSLGGVAAVASMAMGGLTASITGAGIAASALATGGVALLIGGFAALTIGLYNAAFGHSKFVEEVANGDQPMKEAREELAKLNDTLEDYQERLENAVTGQGALRLSQQIAVLKGQIQELNEAMEVQAYAKKGKGFVGPLPLTGDPDADQARFRRYSRTTFPGITPDGKDGKGKEARPMLMEELRLRQELRRQKEEGTKVSALEAQYNLDVYMAKLETKDLNKRQNMIEDARHKLTMAIAGEMDGMLKIAEEHQSLTQDINKELEDRKYKLGLISEEEYKQFEIAREKARLEEKYKGPEFAGKRAELADLYRREIDPTFQEAGETEVKRMKDELEEMTKPLNQLKGAAMAFGESISQAFSNIVTGSQTAQQAMAQFLKNLGQYFVEYAAKVITQMIAIATIQAVIKALGGPSTSGGGTQSFDASGVSFNPDSFAPGLNLAGAQGAAFNKGVKKYAMGGVVNKPTMFTYAEGGTGRFGLMGEAGPEAIIPLKRGNDGRLGVSAYFADANAAMAKGAANRSSSAEAFDENADALAMSSSYVRERSQERERQTMLTGAGGSMLIQTQVINNVEYATMDQVAQATAASAKQARAQVFADMRNKPSTRSSLGMR